MSGQAIETSFLLPYGSPSGSAVFTEGTGHAQCDAFPLGHSPHRAHTGLGWVYSHWGSGAVALGLAALPAVPDLQLLLTLDFPLQLQDAVEQCLGCGRAA